MSTAEPWNSNHVAQVILTYTQFSSPPVLLLAFLIAFVTHSVIHAPEDEDASSRPLGPGGKPLPRSLSAINKAKRKQEVVDFSPARKTLFNCLSIFVILTFLASATLTIVHALLRRAENWWCGQSAVVRRPKSVD